MAWGAPRGIADLVARVGHNDPSLQSLCMMRGRQFDDAAASQLCEALAANTVPVYVGGAGVDNTTGYELAAGKDVAFLIEDPSLIYSYCGTASQKLHIIWM